MTTGRPVVYQWVFAQALAQFRQLAQEKRMDYFFALATELTVSKDGGVTDGDLAAFTAEVCTQRAHFALSQPPSL